MHALKMQPFVPPPIPGRKHLSYNLLIVGVQGAGKYCLHHQFVYACFPSIRDPFFDSETPEVLWKSDGNDRFAFQVQPKRMDISRPETATHPQHLYPTTRLPVDLYRFTDANGMILVFNIDSRSSFDALKHVIEARNEDTKSKQVEPKVLCLVGNKLDKSRDRRKILCLEGEEFAAKLGCPYVECSAKDQKGLDKVKTAVIKAMETQRSQLQYEHQQRERAAQGSRGFNQKPSLVRRLTGGSQTRSETPRIITSLDSNSSQIMSRRQRHRNGALISPSGRYKGGLATSSLSSEDRIDEEDEETESDDKSRSSSQQSSNTSTSSKQSSITITPPCNALSSRPSYSQRLTMERSPPSSIAPLSPVNEKPQARAHPPSNFTFHASADPPPKAKDDISTTSAEHTSNTESMLQYQAAPQEEGQPEITPTQPPESSPINSRGISPQHTFNPRSSSLSRDPSPKRVEDIQRTTCHDMIKQANSMQLPPIFFSRPNSPPADEQKKLEEGRPILLSRPVSPTVDEKRKLDEERAELEEAKQKLRQELEDLKEHQARLDMRRRGDAERRRIEEERKKIVEERKRIEEERESLREAKRIIEEEEKLWESQEPLSPDEEQAEHESTMDEHFGDIFPGIEPQGESQDDTKHEATRRYHQEQYHQERGIEPQTESQDDTRHEVTRRYHQEQFQQERQQDLQLASTNSSSFSAYSAPRDYFTVQKPASRSESNNPLTRHVSAAHSTSPPRREGAKLQKRTSLRTTRLATQQAERSPSDKSRSAGSPPLSPDITLSFRRFLGKKEAKKLPQAEQLETMKFLRDELGIAMPQMPAADAPPPRSPKSLLLPPGTKIEHKETVAVTKKASAEEKPKAPFPGK